MKNALTTCKSCGKEVAKGAICPNCGKDQRNFFMKHKIITGIMVLILIGIIGAIGSGGNSDTPKQANTSTPASSSSSNTSTTSTTSSDTSTTKSKEELFKEKYNKITNGMTIAQVKAIAGEPDSVSENEIEGLGKTEMYHYQAGFSAGFEIYFQNGKVSMKNWTKL